jgi:prephenate dehydrogenase
MKYVKIKGQKAKVTKKYIREVLSLPNVLSYYPEHAQNLVAITVQYATRYAEDSLSMTVDIVYNNFELLVEAYENDHHYGG